jgi:hypothetical protein
MAIRFFVEGQSRSRGYGLCGTHNYRGLFTLENLHKGRSARLNFLTGFCGGGSLDSKNRESKGSARSWMMHVTNVNNVVH